MNTQSRPSILVSTILTGFLAAFYLADIETVKFHPDESQWIASSQVFEEFSLARFDSPQFDESYWTLTQPPLARYLIGMGRRIGGYRWADLNLPWVWGFDAEANVERGAMPSEKLLWWSRLPMALLAVVSIMIGFGLVRASAGQVAGFIWIALGMSSSYLLVLLRRAMGESPLLACIALEALVCYRVLLVLQTEEPAISRKLLVGLGMLGVVAGVAGTAKLNGLSAVLVGVVLAIVAAIKHKSCMIRRLLLGLLANLAVVLCSSFAFVGLNPYLWPDPLERTQRMLEHRVTEMDNQQRIYPEARIGSLGERVRIIPERVFQTCAAVSFQGSTGINILLFVVGLCYLARKSWRSLWKGLIEPAPTAIVLVALPMAIPPLFTPLDWERYYLLPVFFTTFFIAIGAAVLGRKLYELSRAAYERKVPTQRI